MNVLYRELVQLIVDKLEFYDTQRLKHTNRRLCSIINIYKIPEKLFGKLNDQRLKYYPHLTEIYAADNLSITDAGMMGMRLTKLDASYNSYITDKGITGMPLRELYADDNPNITDVGIMGMQLNTLHCEGTSGITDAGIMGMPLRELYANGNYNITKAGIRGMPLRVYRPIRRLT